jgi:hypothetical protein
MLTLDVKVGQALQIGADDPQHGVVIKVEEKSGRRVQLAIATAMSPIRIIADGLFPSRFTTGISGHPRRILEPVPGYAQSVA